MIKKLVSLTIFMIFASCGAGLGEGEGLDDGENKGNRGIDEMSSLNAEVLAGQVYCSSQREESSDDEDTNSRIQLNANGSMKMWSVGIYTGDKSGHRDGSWYVTDDEMTLTFDDVSLVKEYEIIDEDTGSFQLHTEDLDNPDHSYSTLYYACDESE